MTWWHVLISVSLSLLVLIAGGWALVCWHRTGQFERDARAAFDEGDTRW